MSDTPPPIKGVYLGPDDEHYQGGSLLHNLLLFGRVCRALGMDITPNRMMEVARALEFVNLGRRGDVYDAMCVFMVHDHRDLPRFKEAFDLFWQRPAEGWTKLNLTSLGEERLKRKTQFLPPGDSAPSSDDDNRTLPFDPSMIAIVPTYSQQETLRYKDFAEMSADELAMAQQIITRIPQSLSLRRTRRFKSGRGSGIDLRRIIRHNIRYQGEILHLPTRTLKWKPRPIVLICDISGSMERYTRVLLHFAHTLARGMFQVESFVFSTDLTRITHPIRHKSIDTAMREVGGSVKGWGGGTRIGEALHTFNYRWSRRVLGRGAVVMLITDGWDRGDVDLLHREAQRLQRASHRFIWLNPLLDIPEYEPLTRGAQALLPYVDDFLPVRNLANLEMILKALQEHNWRRPARPDHHRFIVK